MSTRQALCWLVAGLLQTGVFSFTQRYGVGWELCGGERWGLFPKLMRKLGFTSKYHPPPHPKTV